MALPERIRAEIEASFAGGPEPPTAAAALAAGRKLLRRRRIGAVAASVVVAALLLVRVAVGATARRAHVPLPPPEDPS